MLPEDLAVGLDQDSKIKAEALEVVFALRDGSGRSGTVEGKIYRRKTVRRVDVTLTRDFSDQGSLSLPES